MTLTNDNVFSLLRDKLCMDNEGQPFTIRTTPHMPSLLIYLNVLTEVQRNLERFNRIQISLG